MASSPADVREMFTIEFGVVFLQLFDVMLLLLDRESRVFQDSVVQVDECLLGALLRLFLVLVFSDARAVSHI